ncbi:MAG TPA: hypothetical protein PLD27_00545 [bacterium]|nr:hypothetical protein [bacterium]HOL47211.1 hypothetical protein [bacterium]HPQ18280.1 hypothetical protein [bacterium]
MKFIIIFSINIFIFVNTLFSNNISLDLKDDTKLLEKLSIDEIKSLNISLQEKLNIIEYLLSSLEGKKNYQKLIDLNKYASEISNNDKYFMNLIVIFKQLHNNNEIKKITEELLEKRKNDFNFYKRFSVFFSTIADLENAISILKKGRENFRNEIVFFWELKSLYEANNDIENLIKEYINYLNISFDYYVKNDFLNYILTNNLIDYTITRLENSAINSRLLYELLTELYLQKKDYDKAVNNFLKISNNKEELNHFVNRLLNEKYYEAVKILNQKLFALKLKNSTELLVDLCKIAILTNDLEQAEIILETIKSDSDDNIYLKNEIKRLNSQYYSKILNYEKALEYLLEIDNKNNDDKIKIIKYMCYDNKYNEALEFIKNEQRLLREVPFSYFYFAIVYLFNNDYANFNNYLNEYINKEEVYDNLKYVSLKLVYIKNLTKENYEKIKEYVNLIFEIEKNNSEKIFSQLAKYLEEKVEEDFFLIEEILDYLIKENINFSNNETIYKAISSNNIYQALAKAIYYIIKNSEISVEKKLNYLRVCEIPELQNTIYYPLIIKESQINN